MTAWTYIILNWKKFALWGLGILFIFAAFLLIRYIFDQWDNWDGKL